MLTKSFTSNIFFLEYVKKFVHFDGLKIVFWETLLWFPNMFNLLKVRSWIIWKTKIRKLRVIEMLWRSKSFWRLWSLRICLILFRRRICKIQSCKYSPELIKIFLKKKFFMKVYLFLYPKDKRLVFWVKWATCLCQSFQRDSK